MRQILPGWRSGRWRSHSPVHEAYVQIAPRKEDWPVLVTQLTTALKINLLFLMSASGSGRGIK
jgi:hypothetical protein